MEKLHVLVIDDEQGMRIGVERALTNFSVQRKPLDIELTFWVSQTDTAEKGLEILQKQSVDILLLDHKLPGMDGMSLFMKLPESIKNNMVTIMITAYATIESAVNSTKQGIFDFLPKPFTPMELRRSIEKAAVHLILQRRAQKIEEEKRKARFDFIRILGHELKAPIAAVEGFIHILRDQTLGSDIKEYRPIIDRCYERLGQMRRLIIDLLDMTRIDSGTRNREIKSMDIVPIVVQLVEAQKSVASQRGIEILTDLPPSLSFNLDLTEFEIIMNNLLTNAIKYNKENGKVFVRVSKEKDKLYIEVEDTGIGIREEDIPKLFREFSRLKTPQTKNIMGTGLGLSILKRLVELYEGEIEVASRVNEGTKFSVFLREPKIPNLSPLPEK